jgi:hypothetical protein
MEIKSSDISININTETYKPGVYFLRTGSIVRKFMVMS